MRTRFAARNAGWALAAVILAGAALVAQALATGPAFAGDGKEAPAASCQPRLQTFFAADFTDAAYQQKAYNKVAAAWKRPPTLPAAGSKAVVIVSIARDGGTGPPLLHMKSGSDPWDAAAILAVKSASPFEALPKSYPRDTVEVHFHFECARPGR